MSDSVGALFQSLLGIMSRLRGDGGCPWDREQTRESLKPYLIEEAYEVVQAIDDADVDGLIEELGDLLFQVVFHCQVAQERGEFGMGEVLARLSDKMLRRHPHVFGGQTVQTAGEALRQWERIKEAEHRENAGKSVLGGTPGTLPALLRAQRLQAKAARVGFDWEGWQGAWEKAREEADELGQALAQRNPSRIREELGDLLFSIVNVARLLDLDAEDALRQATAKFTRRFQEVEAQMAAAGRTLSGTSPEDLDRAWREAKAREPGGAAGAGEPR
jgi:tetrapyrrole methylase family protein/MazG family protein